jgi:hypothetical protein
VAPTNVIMPRPKAPAATPASERLPMRIALDNAFPFDASACLTWDVACVGYAGANRATQDASPHRGG